MPERYRNARLNARTRADDLLARMTIEEKVGQTHQVTMWRGATEHEFELARTGRMGSAVVGGSDADAVQRHNDVQRAAVEEARLGIPVLFAHDVIHGWRTIFPIPLGQAAAWDPALVEEAAACAAREARASGVHWTFAPMVDIARDPRWGRIAEGFGEDPHLCAALAAAAVRGFQGEDLSDPERVLACAKHYVAYGGAEGGRDYNTVECTDNTLRNVYLPPFHAAVQAGVGSVMSAFHEIGGEPVTCSRYLLTDVLKEEFAFAGFVVSDAFAVKQLMDQGVAADRRQAAGMALNAGVDADMWSGCYLEHVADLVESGAVPIERLDDAVRRILLVKFRLGLFERPYGDPALPEKVILRDEHRLLARRVAARSIVLLKNNGVLPLSKDLKRIAVLGPMAEDCRGLMGCWHAQGQPEDTVPITQGVREALPDARVLTSPGQADVMQVHARRADAVVLVVGENNCSSGEANCVTRLKLPPGQDELVRALKAVGKPLVLVVCAGRPLAIGEAADLADAVLYAWHPGSEAGHAVADVLFGDVSPTGRLPVTFPRSVGQVPIHYNAKRTGRFTESWPLPYVDDPARPLYPFGYGLSYTTFGYSDVRVRPKTIRPGETVTVSARVTNTGRAAGEEVAQCYVRDCVASTTRPERELKGFARVALAPGESVRARFRLGPDELGFCGRDGRFAVEPGEFLAWVGGDSRAALQASFRVAE